MYDASINIPFQWQQYNVLIHPSRTRHTADAHMSWVFPPNGGFKQALPQDAFSWRSAVRATSQPCFYKENLWRKVYGSGNPTLIQSHGG